MKGRTPNKFRRVARVHYPATAAMWNGFTQKDNFGVRWSGFLVISRKGVYRFSIASDDGSKLYIDNKFIVNNDGTHSMKSREANYRCSDGQHYLRIEMFEKAGKAGMIFSYKGPDTENQMIGVSGKTLR